MSDKCPKCEDGWIKDGNARGHSGSEFHLCDCRKGAKRALQAIHQVDPQYADPLRRYVKRLEGIVEKLPKTADGVPVTPGMTVWHRDFRANVAPETAGWKSPFPNILRCCYSTCEAAEAAKAAETT